MLIAKRHISQITKSQKNNGTRTYIILMQDHTKAKWIYLSVEHLVKHSLLLENNEDLMIQEERCLENLQES